MAAPIAAIIQTIIDDLMGVGVQAMSKQPRGWGGPGGDVPTGITGTPGGEAIKGITNAIGAAADVYGRSQATASTSSSGGGGGGGPDYQANAPEPDATPYNDEFSFGPPGYKFNDPNELLHYMINNNGDNAILRQLENEYSSNTATYSPFDSAYRW